jgi:N-methylhydantoinase A
MHLGVDVGGTFTDAVLHDGAELHTAKAPTTPQDQSVGVLEAIGRVLERAGVEPAQVRRLAHGMTVGTNALLELRGARTALIATRGFTDLLEIARQNRPELYRLCAAKPASLIEERLRFGVDERIGPDGVVRALDDGEIDRIVEAVGEAAPESVALCLLFSYLDPRHEQALAERLRQRLPGTHVSASHEVLPRFREYERCSTTAIDAYLSPLVAGYLDRLGEAALARGLPEPLVMLSSGGVAPLDEAAGAATVLSGPAGGAVGAGLLASISGERSVLGLDMGGTSCDVCVVEGGAVRHGDGRSIGGRVLALPMVDVHTVGAGGGSIAWRDPGGALRVGPRSAGAEPGPACYGRGSAEATVTDANLLLGYLDAGSPLAGGVRLDAAAAERAIAALGQSLGLDVLATAAGIVRVANQEMSRALRVVTIERGVDPRRFALMPFGGAGPLHAAALAEELGIDTIVCPRAGGVLSALGLVASERRRDVVRTVMLAGEELSAERIAAAVGATVAMAATGMDDPVAKVAYAMRYRGQAFELRIEGEPDPGAGELVERFAAEHERRYGYRDPEGEVELVDVHVAVSEPGPELALEAASGPAPIRSQRRASFDGAWVETAVVRGEPPARFTLAGPAIFELTETTLVLPAGWSAEVDRHGTIAARRDVDRLSESAPSER